MIGSHWIADLSGCDPEFLKDEAALNRMLENAIAASNATILKSVSHKFGGEGGVTGLFLLSESHASYHSYPELNYIALDIFTCGDCDPRRSGDHLLAAFQPIASHVNFLRRDVPRVFSGKLVAR
jgi:S-adenosylmethionine decarboxylase